MYGHKMFKIGATAKVVNNGTGFGDFEDGYGTVAPDNKLNSYIIGGTVTPIEGPGCLRHVVQENRSQRWC